MKVEKYIPVEKELEAITFIVNNLWDVLKVENDSNVRIKITFDPAGYPYNVSLLPDYFIDSYSQARNDFRLIYPKITDFPFHLFTKSTTDFTFTFSNATLGSYGEC